MTELLQKHRLSKAVVKQFANYQTVHLGVFNCHIREGEEPEPIIKAFAAYILHMNEAALDPLPTPAKE